MTEYTLASETARSAVPAATDLIPITTSAGVIGSITPALLGAAIKSETFVAGGATLTLTAASHAGRTIKFDTAAGTILTLPAATGSGNKYRAAISVIATSNSHIMKVANASDTMVGIIITMSDDPATAKAFLASGTSDTITLNRTTTGSTALGEWIEAVDFASTLWLVSGVTASTGTEATPFSATV